MYFILFLDNRREWRWRLRTDTHLDIAASSSGYTTKEEARLSAALVKNGASVAKMFDADEKTWTT